ncbi:acyl-CoA thioesterase [Leucobacter allii]|uniref:Acyl-CoA thioesterase n=1 Tax=Leucobacter allii TaxID=2932247 RepID=A0ABY4FJZ3_9MICO|nr:thioesterase family protein [Leucobacter allii]UOQ56444.1 acyl-CoA thioesterase [Leucobacter allii]UOR00878.1 acyl-CoA thioesterase [Leucobacter allii]
MTPIVSFHGIAHPWLCDANGHLNTRHYVGAFDDAAQHFLAEIGGKPGEGFGWADVSQRITYLREVSLGALFTVDCDVQRVGRSSIDYLQRLTTLGDEEPAAIVEAVTVRFDLRRRRASPLPEAFADRARELLVDGPVAETTA